MRSPAIWNYLFPVPPRAIIARCRTRAGCVDRCSRYYKSQYFRARWLPGLPPPLDWYRINCLSPPLLPLSGHYTRSIDMTRYRAFHSYVRLNAPRLRFVAARIRARTRFPPSRDTAEGRGMGGSVGWGRERWLNSIICTRGTRVPQPFSPDARVRHLNFCPLLVARVSWITIDWFAPSPLPPPPSVCR